MAKEMVDWTNPIVEQRADPWLMKHTDGYYYFIASVPAFDCIELRRAKCLEDLRDAEAHVIWHEHHEGPMCNHIWAPEIHYVEGKWYIYFAGAHSEDEWKIRMYVLECDHQNPLSGEWIEKGQIQTAWDSFSLDATTFEHKGRRYLIWAQKGNENNGNSNLYIDEMLNPWTLAGKQILLSKPEYDWEMIGFEVNEGPAVLKYGDKIFVTYSASKTDHNYCMGLLEIGVEGEILRRDAWIKHQEPVFETSETAQQYGPGHNSFVRIGQSNRFVMVYHARNYKEIIGDPLNDPNRHSRAQVVQVLDGKIDFGAPVKDGAYHG